MGTREAHGVSPFRIGETVTYYPDRRMGDPANLHWPALIVGELNDKFVIEVRGLVDRKVRTVKADKLARQGELW